MTKDFSEVLERLTGRDMELIDALARHRVLTAAQMADLYFPSTWAARVRAVTLVEMEVLARFRDDNRKAYRYTLGYWGGGVHAWRQGESAPTRAVVALAVHQLAVSRKRGHLEGVNAFFARMHAESREAGGLTVGSWLCEDEAAGLFLGKVRPDGAGTLMGEGCSTPFFFEYDTGSEPLGYLAAKLDRYAAKQPVGGNRLVLLQIIRPGRERNFHDHLAGRRFPFLIATTSAGAGFLGACWRVLGSERPARLSELGAAVRS
ncbi:Replication-relaxation [Glycomyces sambucus]|uniref:Replication-relaxation n=1 Tax=Glycomyces sambucus TaxID=380244 RepID=A0A1G9GIR9_9ACTN|nr:Replication-relaxation [Glycomyces sambucus]